MAINSFSAIMIRLWSVWRWLATIILIIAAIPAWADVPVPPLTARVIDQTGTLTDEQIASLETELKTFEARKGSQIAVLMIPTTQPETIEQYSIRVVDQWKLGRKGVDDGVLLLVAKDDHKLRIEVGYGLEGVIPDITANRIINEIITPYFKRGDFYGGIQAGVDRLIRLIDGEPLPAPSQQDISWSGLESYLPVAFIGIFVIGSILRIIFGRMFGAVIGGTIASIVFWTLLSSILGAVIVWLVVFLFLLAGGGRGGYGGWTMGGGGFGRGGGFGGGGFSGGGGGFGGGGSSGSW